MLALVRNLLLTPLPLRCLLLDLPRWEQALEAYERARDMDSVVRLCLDQLDRADRAFAIVRENASRWATFTGRARHWQ